MIKEIGKIIIAIEILNEDHVKISFEDGCVIEQYHEDDCCEQVWVSQVDSDPQRFIGADAYWIKEKVTDCEEQSDDSCTATFYTLATSKGYLDWRWQGESNGYYSESVTMNFIGEFVSL